MYAVSDLTVHGLGWTQKEGHKGKMRIQMWTSVKSSRFPFTCLVRIGLLMIMSRERRIEVRRKVCMRLLRPKKR